MSGILLLIFGALVALISIAYKILSLLKQQEKKENIFIDEKKNLENWTWTDQILFLRSKNIDDKNNTMYPLFSEYDLAWQQLGYEIALRKAGSYEEQINKTKEDEIYEWINKYDKKGFIHSDSLMDLVRKYTEWEMKFKKSERRLRDMIEANISILNGAGIEKAEEYYEKKYKLSVENFEKEVLDIDRETKTKLENIKIAAEKELVKK